MHQLQYTRYLEAKGDAESVREVFKRACSTHLPKKPTPHLAWSAFEEKHGHVCDYYHSPTYITCETWVVSENTWWTRGMLVRDWGVISVNYFRLDCLKQVHGLPIKRQKTKDQNDLKTSILTPIWLSQCKAVTSLSSMFSGWNGHIWLVGPWTRH